MFTLTISDREDNYDYASRMVAASELYFEVFGAVRPIQLSCRRPRRRDRAFERDYHYDPYGRVERVATQIVDHNGSYTYTEKTTYDEFGRVFQQFDASGGDRGIRHHYNERGYLSQLQEARYGEQGRIYWFAQDQDAWGNVTRATLGNQLVVRADYDPATGWLMNLWTDDDSSIAAQNLELMWDAIGNLTARIDHSHAAASLFEAFTYDDRNRLRRVEHKVGENGSDGEPGHP